MPVSVVDVLVSVLDIVSVVVTVVVVGVVVVTVVVNVVVVTVEVATGIHGSPEILQENAVAGCPGSGSLETPDKKAQHIPTIIMPKTAVTTLATRHNLLVCGQIT